MYKAVSIDKYAPNYQKKKKKVNILLNQSCNNDFIISSKTLHN